MPATMTRDEQKVLLAMCRYVINSDGIITEDEIGKLHEIISKAGLRDYDELFNEVDGEISSTDDLKIKIDSLKTSRNRKKIIQYCIQLSRMDSFITYDEVDIIVYAADAWDVNLKELMNKG
ncbi:MAG: TerB family tellurite resistance protein [Spirochaetes bacterium]|nr:TerB family tellurite resistance protein [Spirochaetota bacterium]